MFTKTLFFVLLACAFTYVSSEAQPIEESIRVRRSSASQRLAEELQEIEEKIKSFFGKVGSAFSNWWNKITGKESRQKKAKLEELKSRYEALQRESEAALDAKKRELQAEVATAEENLERSKSQADIQLEQELNKWKVQFEDLKAEADELIKTI